MPLSDTNCDIFKERMIETMFRKKNIDVKNYNGLLEKENKSLKQKISLLENERDRAIAEKDKMRELLDKYRAEYESLIADAKKLIEKQKDAEAAMDRIVDSCKNELERMITAGGV